MKYRIYILCIPAMFLLSCQKDISVTPPDGFIRNLKLVIDSNPQGARIFIDTLDMGQTTPDTIEWVEPGMHSIKLKLDLYKDTSVVINVGEQEITLVHFDYISNPAMLGRLLIESRPSGADIFLAGQSTGFKTPKSIIGLTPGTHEVKLKLNGYWDERIEAVVSAGNTTYIDKSMTDTSLWVNYNQSTISELPTNYYSCMDIQRGYIKWFGGPQNDAVVRFDGNEWTIFNTSNSPLPSNNISSIKIKNDDVWIGTDNGAAHYNNNVWQIYNTSNTPLQTNRIECIFIDHLDRVWLGTFGKGVYMYDGVNWSEYNKNNTPMISDFIKSIFVETNGSFWFGTNGYGLIQFDGTDWRITNNRNLPRSQNIEDIYVDEFSNVWLACSTTGLDTGGVAARIDNKWKIFYTGKIRFPSAGINVLDMEIDQQRNFWFASYELGMVKYDGTWKITAPHNSRMLSNKVNAIAIDGQGHKWLTTYGAGIIKYKGN